MQRQIRFPNREYLFRRPRHQRRRPSWQYGNDLNLRQPEFIFANISIIIFLTYITSKYIVTFKLLTGFLRDFIITLWIIKNMIATDRTVSALLRCISLTALSFFDAVLLYLWLLPEIRLIYREGLSPDVYHHFLSSSFYERALETLWNAIELFAETFSLFWMMVSGTYKLLSVPFTETAKKANSKILNYATSIGSWFLRNICHFVILLVAHFPGGIIGIGILLLVTIVAKMFAQQFYKQSKEYTTCLQDIQQLQRQLEATEMQFKEQSHKLKQQIECFQKLEENIEKLKQECVNLKSSNLNFLEEKDEKLCAICQDQVKTILLLPCQHMCLCKKCLNKKKWEQCPICRQDVESSMEANI